jgi:hypothetical protein
MKNEMNKWRDFRSLEEQKIHQGVISFYKTPPTPEYITEVLGIQVPLNESYTEYSQTLVEEIIQEQILFEGFFDSIKGKAKEYGQGLMDLFTALKTILARPRLLKNFMRRLKMYVSNIKENFNNFIQKVLDKVPSLATMMTKIKDVIQKAFSIADNAKGYKGALVLSGLIVIFTYIQDKFGDVIKNLTNVEENAKLLYQYMIEKYNLESVSKKILGTMTDIRSYLGILGPIVGGVKFVADALGSITRPFVEKYVEAEPIDLNT